AQLRHFNRHLGFDAEAVGMQVHVLQQLAAEGFVAGGDVVNRNAGEQIADDRKQPVQQKAIVTLNTVRSAVKAVAEDGVSVAFKNGCKQEGIVAGVIFEVGILDEDDLAGGLRQSGSDAGSLALVLVVKGELHCVFAVVAQNFVEISLLQEFAGAVGGEVIDDDELFFQA